jgi:hypothetical protein
VTRLTTTTLSCFISTTWRSLFMTSELVQRPWLSVKRETCFYWVIPTGLFGYNMPFCLTVTVTFGLYDAPTVRVQRGYHAVCCGQVRVVSVSWLLLWFNVLRPVTLRGPIWCIIQIVFKISLFPFFSKYNEVIHASDALGPIYLTFCFYLFLLGQQRWSRCISRSCLRLGHDLASSSGSN